MEEKRVRTFLPAWWCIRTLARTLKFLLTNGVVEIGRENLPDEGSLVINHNHNTTSEDAGALQAVINRALTILYKKSLESFPFGFFFVMPFLRLAGFIPVQREVKDTVATAKTRWALQHGRWVVAMPQGTSRNPTLSEGKRRGTARLAMEGDYRILPVAIHGADGAIGSGLRRLLLRKGSRKTITILYGKPIPLSALGLSLENDPEGAQATHEIMVRIGAMLPEAMRGYYTEGIAQFLASDAPDVVYYRDTIQPLVKKLS